jgi:hypothetical protein
LPQKGVNAKRVYLAPTFSVNLSDAARMTPLRRQMMAIRKKTGQMCELAGTYAFDGYVEPKYAPSPTPNEREIPMEVGETFPPVRSTERAAWWKWVNRR